VICKSARRADSYNIFNSEEVVKLIAYIEHHLLIAGLDATDAVLGTDEILYQLQLLSRSQVRQGAHVDIADESIGADITHGQAALPGEKRGDSLVFAVVCIGHRLLAQVSLLQAEAAILGIDACGGVGAPNEIEGNTKLQEAYAMGKSV
jgi:hypothetical protein